MWRYGEVIPASVQFSSVHFSRSVVSDSHLNFIDQSGLVCGLSSMHCTFLWPMWRGVPSQSLSHVPLCSFMDCSLPGSSVRGISQTRILVWGTISSSRGSSQPRHQTCVSCSSCIADSFLATEPLGKPQVSTWEEPNPVVLINNLGYFY